MAAITIVRLGLSKNKACCTAGKQVNDCTAVRNENQRRYIARQCIAIVYKYGRSEQVSFITSPQSLSQIGTRRLPGQATAVSIGAIKNYFAQVNIQ